MAGKRVATSKISKDDPEGIYDDAKVDDGQAAEEQETVASTERKISRPAKRHVTAAATGGVSSNPFVKGGRSNPFAILQDDGDDREGPSERPAPGFITSMDRLLQLRGLNHSFEEAIRLKLEKDATADLSPLFHQYEAHQKGIPHEKEPVATTSKVSKPSAPTTASAPFIFGSTLTGITDNKPPSAFSGPAAFAFTAPSVNASVSENKTLTFPFPTPVVVNGKSSTAGAFTFGGLAAAPKQGEDKSSNEPQDSTTKTTPFTFESSKEGSTVTPLSKEGPTIAPLSKEGSTIAPLSKEGSTIAPLSFGAPKDAAFPAASGTGPSSAPIPVLPPFSFTVFGTDNSAADKSTNASAPFSFGSTTATKLTAPTSTSGAAPFAFSFSTPLPSFTSSSSIPPVPAPATATSNSHDAEEEGIPEGEEASFSGERTNTDLIKRGAGEEGEETIREERIKLYSLEREDGWRDLGVAIGKVNRNAEGKCRLLVRSEGTGKLLLNTWLAGVGVDHIEGRKDFAFLCVTADGKPTKYLIRCKGPSQAAALSTAIASNIH